MLAPDMRGRLVAGAGLLAIALVLAELGMPALGWWLMFGAGAVYLAFGGGGRYLLDVLARAGNVVS